MRMFNMLPQGVGSNMGNLAQVGTNTPVAMTAAGYHWYVVSGIANLPYTASAFAPTNAVLAYPVFVPIGQSVTNTGVLRVEYVR